MITTVFFDLYNTLVRFDPPPEYLQQEACRNLGIDIEVELVRQGYILADRLMAEQNAIVPINMLSREDRRDFFGKYERIILRASGIEVTVPEALDIFRVVQRLSKGLAIFPDTFPCLRELQHQGISVGLITNMDETIRGRGDVDSLCKDLGIRQFFDVIVTSTSAGVAKPDPVIFQMGIDAVGARASESVHVGDQLLSDVQGAEGAGMIPVLLDRQNSYAGLVHCHRIVSLEQLVKLIATIEI
jgi:putative hydrolase of the HAD superfamily